MSALALSSAARPYSATTAGAGDEVFRTMPRLSADDAQCWWLFGQPMPQVVTYEADEDPDARVRAAYEAGVREGYAAAVADGPLIEEARAATPPWAVVQEQIAHQEMQ